jgi:hypothetical protein
MVSYPGIFCLARLMATWSGYARRAEVLVNAHLTWMRRGAVNCVTKLLSNRRATELRQNGGDALGTLMNAGLCSGFESAAPTIEKTAKAQHRKMLGLLLSWAAGADFAPIPRRDHASRFANATWLKPPST